MNTDSFKLRHIGPRENDHNAMLNTIGVDSLEQLINQTIPDNIRLKNSLALDEAMSEQEYLEHIQELATKNKNYKSYIGLGYHPSILPAVIQRNILENPGWYTAYTPYQAEIAQGRLEALLNFQTMITDLTGMEIANASLLDESTAAAEAMSLLFAVRDRGQKKNNIVKFFVSEDILPQTFSLLQTRANPLGIELLVGKHETFSFSSEFFGALLQYPGKTGQVNDISTFISLANKAEIKVAVAADILSLVKLEAPGKFGADIVVGQLNVLEFLWVMVDHMQLILQQKKLIKDIFLVVLLALLKMQMVIVHCVWHFKHENNTLNEIEQLLIYVLHKYY